MNPVLKNFVRVIVFVSFLSLWHLAAAQDTLLSVTQKKQLQGQQRAQTIEDKVKELSVQLNLTNKQLVVGSTVLAIYFPCMATFLLLIKELGLKRMLKAVLIMLATFLVTGTGLNALLSLLHW